MDIGDISMLATTVIAVVTAAVGAITTAWRWAKAQARAEMLREQSAATITAKNAELEDLEGENRELKAENVRLWRLVEEKHQ